jgi:hypothetical protein
VAARHIEAGAIASGVGPVKPRPTRQSPASRQAAFAMPRST